MKRKRKEIWKKSGNDRNNEGFFFDKNNRIFFFEKQTTFPSRVEGIFLFFDSFRKNTRISRSFSSFLKRIFIVKVWF